MFSNTTTSLIKNIVSISILSVVLFYQKDEPSIQNKIAPTHKNDQLKRYQKKLLKNRVHVGFLKYSAIRLQQTINDSREL